MYSGALYQGTSLYAPQARHYSSLSRLQPATPLLPWNTLLKNSARRAVWAVPHPTGLAATSRSGRAGLQASVQARFVVSLSRLSADGRVSPAKAGSHEKEWRNAALKRRTTR